MGHPDLSLPGVENCASATRPKCLQVKFIEEMLEDESLGIQSCTVSASRPRGQAMPQLDILPARSVDINKWDEKKISQTAQSPTSLAAGGCRA